MKYEVFISFKRNKFESDEPTRDYALGYDLYQTLKQKGVNVFFSECDLSRSAYVTQIYKALDQASILVVVGTCPEYITSEFVCGEWRAFLTAILGKRKENADIYTYLEGMTVNELPLELYERQSYTSGQKGKLVARILENLNKTNAGENDSPIIRNNAVRPGTKIKFGLYPQSSLGEVAPIEWRVLEVQKDQALLISDRLIDCVPYHGNDEDITWEHCSLREWLNNDFAQKAFSAEQIKFQIVTSVIINEINKKYGVYGGSNTQDKVFALSADEARQYFKIDSDRVSTVTEYAKSQGSYCSSKYLHSEGGAPGWWWLRSPGSRGSCASRVDYFGCIDELGCLNTSDNISVRPALWIKL